ncbi:hypothetical protein GCM10010371_25250 [Streptomyces subrutilus]|uniref:Uncharacterized protein n=1 Tax=Streptomyces subrutilus TaxID=36818 RepID=A0A918QQX4_9ACTN|nr:hypothetical protein GCM10010371_25250 [Streptomyces subrutilus]
MAALGHRDAQGAGAHLLCAGQMAPGAPGRGHPVLRVVQGDHAAAGELPDRFSRRAPGGEGHDAPDLRFGGDPQGRPGSHRVAHEYDRDRSGQLRDGGQGVPRVADRVLAAAVPAPVAVAHVPDEHPVEEGGAYQAGGERPHARGGQVEGGRGAEGVRAAAVQQEHGGRGAVRCPADAEAPVAVGRRCGARVRLPRAGGGSGDAHRRRSADRGAVRVRSSCRTSR